MYRPGRVYNVLSVRARTFIHLSPPCGPLSGSLGLKTAPPRVQCMFLQCGVRVRPPLVFSGTPKLHSLVLNVCVCLFLLPASYTTPRKREKKTSLP